MAIEHDAIPNADLHEPKGINTASNGDVYIANGAGGGSWKAPAATAYGSMVIINNATPVAVTAAVDSTLHTDTDFVQVTTNLVAGPLKDITYAASTLTINTKGVYKIDSYMTIRCDTANNLVGFKYVLNGTGFIDRTPAQYLTDANKPECLSGSGITTTLDVGDTITLWIASEKTANLTVVDSNTVFTLLEAIE